MSSLPINKKITFNFEKQKLSFYTSRRLFSYAKVDEGTKELLNSLRKNNSVNYQNILDLGCGYGILGIFLKKIFPESAVSLIDRDSLAILLTKENASLNNVKVEAFPSLGFENIKSKFDLIVCNFPAKLERKGLKHFISESSRHLNSKGVLAIVIVKELGNIFEEIFREINLKEETTSIMFSDIKRGYNVYHLSFKKELPQVENPYEFKESYFEIKEKKYPFLNSQALREFDTLHFTTELTISLMQNLDSKNIAFINPGQGHSAIAALSNLSPKRVYLISSDLLQLKASSENLKLNKYSAFEQINSDFFEENSDLLVWSVLDEDAKEVIEKLKIYKQNNSQILISGRTNLLKRVLKYMNLEPKKEIKKGKYSALLI